MPIMGSFPGAVTNGVPVGVPRLFAGQAEASEALYRLSRAARDGRSATEDMRLIGGLGGSQGEASTQASGTRSAVRALPEIDEVEQAAGGVVGRGHHPRPRMAGERLPRFAARHRLSRSRAGRLFLGRRAGSYAVSQFDAVPIGWATISPSSSRAHLGSADIVRGDGASLLMRGRAMAKSAPRSSTSISFAATARALPVGCCIGGARLPMANWARRARWYSTSQRARHRGRIARRRSAILALFQRHAVRHRDARQGTAGSSAPTRRSGAFSNGRVKPRASKCSRWRN